MQKILRKITAALSAFILAVALMFSPLSCSGFFRPFSVSLGVSALPIRAEEQPVTDESKGIAALLTLLFANGIRFVGQWDDVSAGAVKLWNDFSTATGNTVTLAALGAGVAVAHGYMRTSANVNNAVSAFQSWYSGAYSVPNTGEVNIPVGTGAIGSYLASGPNVIIPIGSSRRYSNISVKTDANARFVAFIQNGFITVYAVSTVPFTFTTYNDNAASTSSSSSNSGYYTNLYSGNTTGGNYFVFSSEIPLVTGVASSATAAIAYTFGAEATAPQDKVIEGQSYDLKDGYNLNTDQSLLLDIANLAALVASIGLTLDSINDLVQDWPVIFDTPWADTDVPDITFPVPIEDTPDNTIPWVKVPDAVSPDPVPDYVPDSPETEGEYKVLGLENVFPFSIPFDLYYLVNVLVAEPETPSFTYALYDPTTSSLVSQEVNLHQFDTFAALLRKLETVLFIASLIFVTRGLIRS